MCRPFSQTAGSGSDGTITMPSLSTTYWKLPLTGSSFQRDLWWTTCTTSCMYSTVTRGALGTGTETSAWQPPSRVTVSATTRGLLLVTIEKPHSSVASWQTPVVVTLLIPSYRQMEWPQCQLRRALHANRGSGLVWSTPSRRRATEAVAPPAADSILFVYM